MNDMQRQAIETLGEIWSLSSDVRLGQLLAHLGFLGEAQLDRGLGYIEDDEMLAIMYRHKAELLARMAGGAQPQTQLPQPAASIGP